MSGVSAIYFLDQKAKPIIFRNYRGEVSQNISENFQRKVLELEEANMKPVFTVNDVHYVWIKHRNIYIVAVAKRNPNLTLIFCFLHHLVNILVSYFNRLEEESIRDNFVPLYEILDEVMDNGYPQTTDTQILKDLIKTESHRMKETIDKSITGRMVGVTRPENIKYKVNQAFVDVNEKVNSLISFNGVMIRSEIVGVVNVNTKLSGMPLLKLGLNDKVFFEVSGRNTKSRTIEMDDLKFHNCVDMNKFNNERIIEFIPPDGPFELMSYRLNRELKPLIWVEVTINQLTSTKVEYNVKAKSNYRAKSIAHNVDIEIPVPNDLKNPVFKTNSGNVSYLPDREFAIWSLKDFQGQREIHLTLQFLVPTIRNEKADKHMTKPINVKFEIPNYTVSGIQVRYLKITEKSGYQAFPYVKYLTTNGDYHIRMV